MNIREKLREIIPPNDYTHRRDFSNKSLIDNLSDAEKKEIEDSLIGALSDFLVDILVMETLAYMKCERAIPAMKNTLPICDNKVQKLIIAAAIFEINKDPEMIDTAIKSFKEIHDSYGLISSFYPLMKFNDDHINNMIRKYTTDRDYLVSYNAKRALGIIKDF